MDRKFLFPTIAIVLMPGLIPAGSHTAAGAGCPWRVAARLDIDRVPSWFPVGFCLLTRGDDQYVAYYDAKHKMTVARRRRGENEWQKATLPSKVGWDSHNYITMAADAAGDIHLAGNMHCVPLIYFRTRTPGDITTFTRLPMTGKGEKRCTYPRFLKDAAGTLLFNYRLGGSGNGMRLWNRYDPETKTWSRFFDTPMFDGKGKCNAYPHGPVKGPDGLFHVVWVWRRTPDCATNHDLSYARSRDLKHWETAAGRPVALPMTTATKGLCVDPVPAGGGIINGCEKLAFDARNRPVISYHKRDRRGHMQIYLARFEDGAWKTRAITDWKKEVPFSGRGAMPFIGIRISGLRRVRADRLVIGYRHRDYGSGRIVVDDATLRPVDEKIAVPPSVPRELKKPEIDFAGIRVKTAGDAGDPGGKGVKYILRWETLPPHHDRPRKPPLPPPSPLQLIRLERKE